MNGSSKAHTTERADARANRERLLAAAIAVFSERGLEAEMKEIAERAGVGIGTIYRNFPRKDDLIAAIATQAVHELEATVERAMTVDDPVAAVRLFIRGAVGIVERYGGVIVTMVEEPTSLDRWPSIARQAREVAIRRVSELVFRGVRAGAFRDDLDPQAAAALLMAGLAPWSFATLRRGRTPDRVADVLVDMFLRGALADGPGPAQPRGGEGPLL